GPGAGIRGPLHRHDGSHATRERRLRLRPGVPARRRARRPHDGGARRRGEGCDLPSRPGRPSPRELARGRRGGRAVSSGRSIPGIVSPPPEPHLAGEGARPAKRGAAALSIASNTSLILLKVVAGTITGSVAVLSEAMHSSIDLIASIVAYISVRKADEPADEDHRYGHEEIENLSAAIEGMLILVGSGVIAYEAIRHLAIGAKVERLGVGITVLGISAVANLVVGSVVA